MRSHYCGEVTKACEGQDVEVCGWINRRRDHGGVIFVDLRDREGLLQVVFEPELKDVFCLAESLRSEYVIQVKGVVRARPEGMINPHLSSGSIEVVVNQLTVLNKAETPPFPLDEHFNVHEDIRLKYRYLDLRREEMQKNLRFRAKATQILRKYLEEEGYLDIETPMLMKATPEGARDYLVPSRTHQGQFFALPQSPQLFKQLLMMAGIDRYYQVVRCFRDEDLRADRQPEFTQLDLEASFVDEDYLKTLMEGLLALLFKELLDVQIQLPLQQMTYHDAIRDYGSDRPDLRIPLKLIDIADLVNGVDFKVFAGPANDPKGRVVALRLPNGQKLSRKMIDEYGSYVSVYGAKGLAYIKVNDRGAGKAGLQSPILKFLPDDVTEKILDRCGAQTGDVIFFGADKAKIVNEAMGALRVKLGQDLELFDKQWAPLWIIDFPMFAETDNGRWEPLHHPFTTPKTDDPQALLDDPENMLSRAYDLVLNGIELGGGSIRIHDTDMQQAVFKLLNFTEAQIEKKFGFFVNALKYGCPPHGGIALGWDRVIMLLAELPSIRDVIAFPKTQSAACMLTQAPTAVDIEQLLELGINVRKPAGE